MIGSSKVHNHHQNLKPMEAKGSRDSEKNALAALELSCQTSIETSIWDLVLRQSLGTQTVFLELLGNNGVKSLDAFSKSLKGVVQKKVERLSTTGLPKYKKNDINPLEYPYLIYTGATYVATTDAQSFTLPQMMLDDFGANQLLSLYHEWVLHLSESI